MQILFISLISLFFVGCGSSKNTDDWKAPNIYYLRADGNKSVVLTSSEDFLLNDYIYVSESQAQSPDIEIIKKESTEMALSSNVKCVVAGKSFIATNSYKKTYAQVKEIIPIDALLYPRSPLSCKIQIQIKNSAGSTKTYVLPERSVNADSFAQDISIKESVAENELSTVQVSDLKSGEKLQLVCDTFSESVMNPGVNSITLEQFTSKVNKVASDIPVKKYKPQQQCRVSMLTQNKKLVSNNFLISFERLVPKYNYSIQKRRSGSRLFLYDLTLSNPYDVPISVGIREASFTVPLYTVTSGGSKEVDKPDRYHYYSDKAQVQFSGEAKIIDKGNVKIVFLMPGESFKIHAFKDSHCKPNNCVHSKVSGNNMPIYNLEYNYRSLEEINSANQINLLEQVKEN